MTTNCVDARKGGIETCMRMQCLLCVVMPGPPRQLQMTKHETFNLIKA